MQILLAVSGVPVSNTRRIVSIFFAAALLSGFFVSTVFADPTPTTLTLTDPNGGEIWSDTHAITWTSTGGVVGDEVTLVWSTDNFVSTSNLIAENIPYSLGTYSWDTNTVAAGTNYRVRVVAESNNSVFDTSNADFTVDNTAPTISNVSIPDAPMNIGDTVIATITVGDDAGVTYTLVSGTIDGFALGSLTRVNATTYTATFTVTEGGADVLAGSNIPVANLVLADTADIPNQSTAYATPISQSSDPIDATRPTLSSVTIASDNSNTVWAKTGDVVTLSFTSNESIGTPTVTIAGQAAVEAGGPTVWTATYTMQAGDAEEAVPFTIAFADLATNSGVQVTAITSGSSVTFDKTLPSIAFTQDVEAGPVASDTVNLTVTETNGNTATYFYGFSADAVCDVADTYSVAYTSGTPFTLNTETNNTKYICAKAVDNAGNIGYSAASANDLNVDVTAPVISSISMPTGVYKINTTFTVTIDADANGYTKGTVVVNGVTLAGALTANGDTTYSINYTVSENNLDVNAAAVPTASVTLVDSVLNESVAFTTVTESGGDVVIDAHRPTLSSVTITSNNANPVWAKTGDIITLSFTGNEALAEGADEPVVTIAGHAIPAVDVVGSGTTWTAVYTMIGTDTEGTVAFTIDFKDVALNTGTPVTTISGGSNVTFDKTPPAAPSITSIAGDNYINDSEKAAVHVVGTAEANSTVSVTLTNGATAGPTSGSADGSGNFDITLDTTAVTDGTVTPSVTATDAAGNTSAADTTPTAIKDVAPPVVSTITTTDADFDGEVDTAVIVFDNPIKDSTFVASDFSIGGAAGTGFTAGTADDNTIIVTHGGVAGTEAKDVTYTVGTATDLAGNPLAAVITADITEIDGAGPVLLSARTIDTTHVTVTFSENLDGATVNGSGNEFIVAGYAVSAASETAAGVATLTVATMPTDATPLVTYTSNGPLNDLAAIPNTAVTPGSATAVDGVAPILSSVTIASNNANPIYAKQGDVVTLAFTSSESISTPTVTIDGQSATPAGGPTAWTATYTMMGTDTEGIVPFSIDFSDLSSPTPNAGTQVTAVTSGPSVLYDRTNPTVDAGTDKEVNAAVSQDATTSDGGSGLATHAWTKVSGPGTVTFGTPSTVDTTISTNVDGVYVLRLTVTDNAGNSAFDEIGFIWDTRAPVLEFTVSANNATGVSTDEGTMFAYFRELNHGTFDENIALLDANLVFLEDASGNDVQVGGTGTDVQGGNDTSRILQVDYGTLDAGTTYCLTILAGAVRDAAGNVTSLDIENRCFTTAQDTTAPFITSLTTTDVGATEADIEAQTNEPAVCRIGTIDQEFGDMEEFDSSSFDGLTHYVALSGLSEQTLYSMYVRCQDEADNTMTTSGNVQFLTGVLDVDAPPAPVITTDEATVNADSYAISGTIDTGDVEDGALTVTLYNGANAVGNISVPDGQTTWSIIAPLTQNATSTFSAKAVDAAGNESDVSNTVDIGETDLVDVDSTAPAAPAFTTTAETLDADQYTLTGTVTADGGTQIVSVYNGAALAGTVSVPTGQTSWSILVALTQGTGNSFSATASDAVGNTSAASAPVVITETADDSTAPTVSLATSDITTNSADIDVTVNESSVCRVGPNDVAFSSLPNLLSPAATSHTYAATGLDDGTAYNFYVRCQDGDGNTSESAHVTFTTLSADSTGPTIQGIQATSIGTDTVTIEWVTDEESTSEVEYGTTSGYGSTSGVEDTGGDMTTNHSVTISALDSSTTYHFRVISKDAEDNSSTSGDNTFETTFDDSTASLAVTGIDAVDTFASDSDDFEDGWSWTFYVTVPTGEIEFAMKFADFVSGANTIAAASNIRYYTAQSTEADTTAEAVPIAGANTYPGSITLDSDLDASTAGRQIEVTVEMKVPVGSAGGSYSAQYGTKSLTTAF